MKEVKYQTKHPNGTLSIYVSNDVSSEDVLYECECAYSAWCDTSEEDDSFLELPFYIELCLRDANIPVNMVLLGEK